MMIRALLAGLLLFTTFAVGGCQPANLSEPETDEIRIGYQLIPNGNPIIKAQGWLEDALEAEIVWVQLQSGSDVNRAFQADEIDIGLLGSNPAAVGLSAGIEYSIVWIHNLIGANEALVVQEDRGIETGQDLRGMTIGTPFASTAHYSLMVALEQAGVPSEEVEILDMQPPDILAAWSRGDLDGAYVWNPVLSELRANGGRVLLDSEDLALAGYPTADLGVVSEKFRAARPEIVAEWVVQQDRAIRYIREFPEESALFISQEFGITAEEAASQLQEVVFLDKNEQIMGGYFPAEGNPGTLGEMLMSTSSFLTLEGVISEVLTEEVISDHITSNFLEQ